MNNRDNAIWFLLGVILTSLTVFFGNMMQCVYK